MPPNLNDASGRFDFPLYIETHRATINRDAGRWPRERSPGLRAEFPCGLSPDVNPRNGKVPEISQPGDFLVFAPEILAPFIYYGRQFVAADGTLPEESDRWTQALVYAQIARECFQQARQKP